MPKPRHILFLLVTLTVGCTEYYAHRIVEPNTTPGKLHTEKLYGRGEHLMDTGRLSAIRRVWLDEQVYLNVWVMHRRQQLDETAPAPTEQGPSTQPTIVTPHLADPPPPPPGSVVILHGYMDSIGRYVPLGEALADAGFDVALVDLRGHGYSKGRYTTWGARERRDVKAVVSDLLKRGDLHRPIHVLGVSMGASTAILYAADDPRVRGVLAVAPYTDGPSAMRRAFWLMPQSQYEQVWQRAGEIAHFDPADTDVLAAARRLQCPLIIVHGKMDAIVPIDHGRSVYEAASTPKQFVTVSWASHLGVLVGRTDWFVEQMLAMASESPHSGTVAEKPVTTPRGNEPEIDRHPSPPTDEPESTPPATPTTAPATQPADPTDKNTVTPLQITEPVSPATAEPPEITPPTQTVDLPTLPPPPDPMKNDRIIDEILEGGRAVYGREIDETPDTQPNDAPPPAEVPKEDLLDQPIEAIEVLQDETEATRQPAKAGEPIDILTPADVDEPDEKQPPVTPIQPIAEPDHSPRPVEMPPVPIEEASE